MNGTKILALLASFYAPFALGCVPSVTAEGSKCAAEPARNPVAVDAIPARVEDVSTIDGILRAFYEVVNVDPDAPRQWARDRTLYVPHVRFIGIGKEVVVYDHQALVDATEPMVQRGFHERELRRSVRRYGNIAHVFSSYETHEARPGADGQLHDETRRGVNSLELFHDGTRWWIASVSWQTESAQHPIPAEFLPDLSLQAH